MSPKQRAPFVALIALLRTRYPDIEDPAAMVRKGLVLVDGAPVLNSMARVRSNASIRLVRTRPLRGTLKLSRALETFALDVADVVALDLGASAGGFSQALLDAGAARVYAVDAGVGALRGALRADPRVVNLERTNLSALDRSVIAEEIDLVTMDLSYLSVADAVPQLDRLAWANGARMVALVKPAFELHAPSLVTQPEDVAQAVTTARKAVLANGWAVLGELTSPVRGAHGAIEVFLYARRSEPIGKGITMR